MKRASLILALAATACASPGPRQYPGVKLKPSANPTAVIAAELAFAQLAQTKGQWTAFRETATSDAEMFVPQRVGAQSWLKGKADPVVSVKWQPHAVFMSCDGSYGVTKGAWQGPKATGYFTTVWQRQKDGKFKWVLDMGDPVTEPLAAPEMIAARVADCSKVTAGQVSATGNAAGSIVRQRDGASDDGTMEWTSLVLASDKAQLTVRIWDGKEFDTMIDTSVAPHAH